MQGKAPWGGGGAGGGGGGPGGQSPLAKHKYYNLKTFLKTSFKTFWEHLLALQLKGRTKYESGTNFVDFLPPSENYFFI